MTSERDALKKKPTPSGAGVGSSLLFPVAPLGLEPRLSSSRVRRVASYTKGQRDLRGIDDDCRPHGRTGNLHAASRPGNPAAVRATAGERRGAVAIPPPPRLRADASSYGDRSRRQLAVLPPCCQRPHRDAQAAAPDADSAQCLRSGGRCVARRFSGRRAVEYARFLRCTGASTRAADALGTADGHSPALRAGVTRPVAHIRRYGGLDAARGSHANGGHRG